MKDVNKNEVHSLAFTSNLKLVYFMLGTRWKTWIKHFDQLACLGLEKDCSRKLHILVLSRRMRQLPLYSFISISVLVTVCRRIVIEGKKFWNRDACKGTTGGASPPLTTRNRVPGVAQGQRMIHPITKALYALAETCLSTAKDFTDKHECLYLTAMLLKKPIMRTNIYIQRHNLGFHEIS